MTDEQQFIMSAFPLTTIGKTRVLRSVLQSNQGVAGFQGHGLPCSNATPTVNESLYNNVFFIPVLLRSVCEVLLLNVSTLSELPSGVVSQARASLQPSLTEPRLHSQYRRGFARLRLHEKI